MCTSSRCHSIALLGMDACIPQSQRKKVTHEPAGMPITCTTTGNDNQCRPSSQMLHRNDQETHVSGGSLPSYPSSQSNILLQLYKSVSPVKYGGFFCERARGVVNQKPLFTTLNEQHVLHTHRASKQTYPQPFTLKHSEYQRGMVVIGKKTPPAQTRRKLPHNAQTRFFCPSLPRETSSNFDTLQCQN